MDTAKALFLKPSTPKACVTVGDIVVANKKCSLGTGAEINGVIFSEAEILMMQLAGIKPEQLSTEMLRVLSHAMIDLDLIEDPHANAHDMIDALAHTLHEITHRDESRNRGWVTRLRQQTDDLHRVFDRP